MKRYTVTNIRFNTDDIMLPANMSELLEYAQWSNPNVANANEALDMYMRTTLVAFRLKHMKFSASESIRNKSTLLRHTKKYISDMTDYDANSYVGVELKVVHPTTFSVVLEDSDEYQEVSDAIKLHMIDHMKFKFQYKFK